MNIVGRGMKYDVGKAPIVQGFIKYFPRAITAVANISGYGFDKYKAWGGWVTVPDAAARYADAEGRHLVNQFIDGPLDPESNLAHLAHKAWNAMATLELALRAADGVGHDTGRQDQGEGKQGAIPR